jgi:hypothetical protein
MSGKLYESNKSQYVLVPFNSYVECDDIMKSVEKVKRTGKKCKHDDDIVNECHEMIIGVYYDKLYILEDKHKANSDMFLQFAKDMRKYKESEYGKISKGSEESEESEDSEDDKKRSLCFIIFEKTHKSIIEKLFDAILPSDLYLITDYDIYEYTDKTGKIKFLQYVSDCDAD